MVRILDRFEIVRELGSGASGEVYLVVDTAEPAKKYAVKALRRELFGRKGTTLLQREFQLLRNLEHGGLAKAVDLIFEHERGEIFLVQEFVEGKNFLEAAKSVEPDIIMAWGASIAATLSYLHSRNIVHGDLKPQNVIISARGPVLIDFGISVVIREGGEGLSGTPVYMAPEVLRGSPFSPRADIYSLGAMLYEALSGSLPYDAPDLQGLLTKQLATQPVSLKEMNPALSQFFSDVVKKMIDKDPTLRYQSALTVARDIAGGLGREVEFGHFLPSVPPFVGRQGELKLIKGWIDSENGGGAVIHGPVGFGTSRLLREAGDYARTKGMRVFELRLNRESGMENFIKVFGDWDTQPTLKGNADVHLGKYKIWEEISNRIEELNKKSPVLICFDDFESVSSFLEEMVRFLVARFNYEGGPKIIAAEAGEKKNIKWDLEIMVEPLTGEEVSVFVENFRGWKLTDKESTKLAEFCGGAPIYLVEIVRNAQSVDELTMEKPPNSLEAMLKISLGKLSPAELRLLEAAAVWGVAVRADVLEKLTGENEEEISGKLEKLVHKGFLKKRGNEYEFTLFFLKKILEESIALGRKRNLHASAGRILLGEENASPMRIARHLILGGELEKGAEWAAKAAEELLSIGAHKDASEICKTALDKLPDFHTLRNKLLEMMGKASSEAGLFDEALRAFRERIEREEVENNDPFVLASLHLEMARCQQRKGEYERAERAVKRAEEALLRVSVGNDSDKERWRSLLVEAKETRALIKLAQSEYGSAAETAQETISELGMSQAVPLVIVRGLAETYAGELNSAVESFQSAVSLLESSGDYKRLLLARSSLGIAFQHKGMFNEALDQYQKALEIAEKRGDLKAQTAMAMNIATLRHQMEDYGEASAMYDRALNLAHRLGSFADAVRIQSNYAALLIYVGDLERARELVESSLVGSKVLGLKQNEGYGHLLRGDILRARGEMLSARKEYLIAKRILSSIGSSREIVQAELRLASLYCGMGEWSRAESFAKIAIEQSRGLDMPELEAQGWLILSKTASGRGQWESALKDARKADEAGGKAGAKDAVMWEIKAVLGHALLKNGRSGEAKGELQKAYEMVIGIRDKLPEEFRDGFLYGKGWETLKDDLERLSAEPEGLSSKWEKLLEINRRLNMEHNLSRLLELIMDSVLMLVQAERGFLILEKNGKLEIPVARNIDKETIKGAKGKISRSIAEEVIKTNKPVITVDALKDQRFDKFASVHELKLRSVLCIPLRVKERVVGSLYVDNRFQVGAFKQDDLKLMEAFADQSAIALENARLIAENELKRRMLESSNAKIRKLVEELEKKVDMQSAQIESLHKELESGKELKTKYDYPYIVGRSTRMKEVFSLMDKVTDSNVPVLIEGESGTGKELVARAIHFNGPRKDKRFLSENCSAIPDTLLESELFGHEKGAFTGAVERKIGIFEAADGGTIFLDEIGDMSLNMQAKLLRVLQDGEVRRVGSEKAIYVDVRVISATHHRLEDLIKDGRFREDLYWRLNVVKISMPPLRDKREDIPLLVDYFVEKLSHETGNPIKISSEAMRVLMAYDWPGNVRELENELKKAALLSGGVIRTGDLSPRLLEATRAYSRPMYVREEFIEGMPLSEALERFEKEYIERTLRECDGNRAKTAKVLGIGRRTLYDKLAKYGLDKNDF